MPCLGTTETIQRVWLLDLTSITERTIPVTGMPFKHQSRLFAPVLGVAATSSLYWISNFDSLHASPMAAVRETVPRRSAPYQGSVNQKVPM
jgi:hypothetical protein